MRAFLALGGLGVPDDGYIPEDERARGYIIGSTGMHALARGLVRNRALTQLKYARARRCAHFVRCWSYMPVRSLRGGHIRDEGLASLVRAMDNNSGLVQRLRLLE